MGVQLTDGRDPRRRAEYEQKKKAFEEVMAPRSCDLGEFSFSHGESIIYIYNNYIYIYIILYILIYTFTNRYI